MLLLSNNLEKAMELKFNIWLKEKQCEGIRLDRIFSDYKVLKSIILDYELLKMAVSKLNNHEKMQYDFMNTNLREAYSSFIESGGRYEVQKMEGLDNAEWYLQKVLVYDKQKNEFVVYLYNAMFGFSEGSYFQNTENGFRQAYEKFKAKK